MGFLEGFLMVRARVHDGEDEDLEGFVELVDVFEAGEDQGAFVVIHSTISSMRVSGFHLLCSNIVSKKGSFSRTRQICRKHPAMSW